MMSSGTDRHYHCDNLPSFSSWSSSKHSPITETLLSGPAPDLQPTLEPVLSSSTRETLNFIKRTPLPILVPPTAERRPCTALAATLPPELLVSILDSYSTPHERQETLFQALLVCKHWYNSTRFPLQYTVMSPWQAERLAAQLRTARAQSRPERRGKAKGGNSHLQVIKLFLNLADAGGFQELQGAKFAELLDQCPGLTSLTVSYGSGLWRPEKEEAYKFAPHPPNTLGWLEEAIKRQTSLTSLTLSSLVFTVSVHEIADLILPLKDLRILDLAGCEVEDEVLRDSRREAHRHGPSPSDAFTVVPPLDLSHLKVFRMSQIADPYCYPLVEAILPTTASLTHIELGRLTLDDEIVCVESLVNLLGPNLVNIRHFSGLLVSWAKIIDPQPFEDLNKGLSQMVNVEKLEISLGSQCIQFRPADVRKDRIMVKQVDKGILEAVRQMPKLRELTLHVRGATAIGPEMWNHLSTLEAFKTLHIACELEDGEGPAREGHLIPDHLVHSQVWMDFIMREAKSFLALTARVVHSVCDSHW
ncbi:hypothetical protein T439DRAFT_384033 [Meredithblackwellia eburnea MCA 4105]